MPTALPYDLPIQRHLHEGEHVLWVGRPRQGWAVPYVNQLLLGVQVWSAILLLRWAAQLLTWLVGDPLGGNPRWDSPRFLALVVAVGLATAWQVVADRRRRAATWYAMTDRRLLFVRTDVVPESVIGVEFDEIAKVRLNRGRSIMWLARPDAIRIELKRQDPYLLNSKVIGYQNGPAIDLADVPGSRELYDLLRWRGRPPARMSNTAETPSPP
jgi:hypothetical protein